MPGVDALFGTQELLRQVVPADARGNVRGVRELVLADGRDVFRGIRSTLKAVGFIVVSACVPALALAFGVWSGSSRFFEVLYLFLWYIGPMHAVAALAVRLQGAIQARRAAAVGQRPHVEGAEHEDAQPRTVVVFGDGLHGASVTRASARACVLAL